MIEWIKGLAHLKEVEEKNNNFLILFFYASFSSPAGRALKELEDFSKEYKEPPVYAIDVEKVKGIHKQFGVESVPTVLTFQKGEVTRKILGVESARFYGRIISGAAPSGLKKKGGKVSNRVVVYSGPGCPACGSAKAYLRQRGIIFREVDISRDEQAAERLVRRSGQRAVPQIDINGHLVVGFDQAKIDRFLSI